MDSNMEAHIHRWRTTHLGYAEAYASSNIPLKLFHLAVVHCIEDYETAERDAESSLKTNTNTNNKGER